MPDPPRDQVVQPQREKTNIMKYPPKFNTERSYERFQDEVLVWEKITSVEAEARGSLLVLSLPDSDSKYGDLTILVYLASSLH